MFGPACCRLLSRQPKPALGNQAALYLVGPDADDPHQRMPQVLLEPSIVDCARHLLGNGGALPLVLFAETSRRPLAAKRCKRS